MSAEEHTPTTAEVRADYENGQWNDGVGPANTGPQFDRWLAAHDAELRAQWQAAPVTDEQVARFKAAWQEADERGEIGNRVRTALEAMRGAQS